jgi:hypothetical protein
MSECERLRLWNRAVKLYLGGDRYNLDFRYEAINWQYTS